MTHQLSFIGFADRVLFIKDGEQVLFEHSRKAMKRLLDEPDSEFARFIGDYSAQQQRSGSRRDSSRTISSSVQSIPQALLPRKGSIMFENLEPIVYDEDEEQNQLKEIKKQEKEKRIQEEDDKVSFVYKAYLQYFKVAYQTLDKLICFKELIKLMQTFSMIKHGNIWLYGPLMLLGFGLGQLFATSCDFYLELWTETVKVHENSTLAANSNLTTLNSTFTTGSIIATTDSTTQPISEPDNVLKAFLLRMVRQYDFKAYSGLIVGFFVLSLARIMIHSIFCMRASVAIHSSLFNRMVRAQMKFFHANPVGIILNRFSVSQ